MAFLLTPDSSASKYRLTKVVAALVVVLAASAFARVAPAFATGSSCGATINPIVCENQLPGDPESDWQPGTPDDPAIEGFATQMSVNVGQTEQFKIKTASTAYHIDILRIGYYGGDGARMVQAKIKPTVSLPQSQPACNMQASTGLIDCGNWGVSASWTVPANAVSGVYVAHLVRDDAKPIAGESSHIEFVVRNDASHSDVLVQTSDATWEAYNAYGGNSLYWCNANCPPGNPGGYKGAFSVSYNRPFSSRQRRLRTERTDLFWAEYPMIRFLEDNGYDLSYTSRPQVAAAAIAAAQPQGLPLQRPRRVLVRRSARGCAERGQQRRQSGVLQWQPDVLEDALGQQHRREQHGLAHLDQLQGDALQRGRRPQRPTDMDRDMARSPLQPTGGRRQS